MSDAVAVPDKTDESKVIREKKIARIVSWMKDYKRNDDFPFASPVRYKGLLITTFSKDGDGQENLILRDIDVVAWFNKAKDHELKVVCDFDEAMLATMPKSRHLIDAAELANGEG